MLSITEFVTAKTAIKNAVPLTLTLPYEQRQKSRLRVTLDNGEEAALQLTRGSVLHNGQLLRAANGALVRICAAPESVSTAYANNPVLLIKAAYHLGNRHVAVQIGKNWLRYLSDHVLDEMVHQLGLRVVNGCAPFEPEAGAYGGNTHHHA